MGDYRVEKIVQTAVYRLVFQVIYSYTLKNFEVNMVELETICPVEFLEYTNWITRREMWSLALRAGARTYENQTNNTIGSLFQAVKAAVKLVRRTSPHIAEYVRVVFEYIGERVSVSTYTDFLEMTTRIVAHVPGRQESDELGRQLTDFAVRPLVKQYIYFSKATYEVEEWFDSSYNVTNTKTGIMFYFHAEATSSSEDLCSAAEIGRRTCSSFFSTSYSLCCRHLITVQVHNKDKIVRVIDCKEKWSRLSVQPMMVYPGCCEISMS